MAQVNCNEDWNESSVMDLCQNFLSQLPEDKRLKLLAPYVPKYPSSTDAPLNTHTDAPYRHALLDTPNPASPSQAPAKKNQEHTPRDRSKLSPSGRLKTRANQSGSRKRRQVDHADQIEEPMDTNVQKQNQGQQKQYETVPVFIQNSIPTEVKNDPKKLEQVLKSLKPGVQVKSLYICKSGDIKLIPLTPHDENMLRQNWATHEVYGQLKPRLPKEKTASHEATILNLPICITNQEINDQLKENMMSPKDIYRFNKKGTQEPSRNVKVSFGSKIEKDQLIANGFNIYSQHFRVEETKPLPNVLQCFKCQKFGHNFYECNESESKCLRCGGNHRLASYSIPKANAKCANCQGNHAANFKGCSAFKDAQKNTRELEARQKAANLQRIPSSYAAVSQPTTALKPQAILACLAECLSELVSLFNKSVENKQPLDDMAPFKIVATAAARHMNIYLEDKDIFMKAIAPTPASSPAKSSSSPEKTSHNQPCPS